MTETNSKTFSLVEEAQSNPAAALDLATATGAIEGSALLVHTFAATGLTQRELAERAGVTTGRVSQVLSGEENLRLSTVSRYLQAMGYRLCLSATNLSTNETIDSGHQPGTMSSHR